jgi:hypothetical protein
MNLSIKDLEVSKDLSREERAAVHGGNVGLGAVPTITQIQGVETNTGSSNGPGGVQNVFVDVDANQSATIKTIQKAEDNDGNFVFALGLMRGMISR